MGNRAVSRAYPHVEQGPFVRHDRFDPKGWTGWIELTWTFERDRPVVIGAGWFRVEQPAAPPVRALSNLPRRRPLAAQVREPEPPVLVAEIVRRGAERLAVLPGSSLKGAVRQAYELLTPSCVPGAHDACCHVRPQDVAPKLCPACSLFGAPGYGGRLAFGEAVPASPDAVRQGHVRVPTAWPPRKWVPGSVRVYDQARAVTLDGGPAPTPELSSAAWGTFRSKLRLINAQQSELGQLIAALGLDSPPATEAAPAKSPTGPALRVGGKKFQGFGAAQVAVVGAERAYPEPILRLPASEAASWAADLAGTALAVPECRQVWTALHEALSAGASP